MSPLEIISRLCDVTENLSAIVKKQQTIIEQSKIEEAVRAELRQEVEETRQEKWMFSNMACGMLRHRRHGGNRVRKGERIDN